MALATLDFGWLNLVGILVGGFAYFMLGALWYMKLFSSRWVEATGRAPEDFEGDGPGAGMLLMLGGCFVTTAVVAIVYQWGGGATILDGLAVGILLGVGVAAVEGMKAAVYNFDDRVKPWALYAVNGSYTVCGLALAGLVYGLIV
jgi:hypothetical protein